MVRPVQASVYVRQTPGKVLAAFLDEGSLRAWWRVDRALIGPRIGGIYALAWGISPAGFKYVSSGIIESYQPEKHLHIEKLVYFNPERQLLGPMRLRIDVEPAAEGTTLKIVQDGYQTGNDWQWYHEAVSQAWPTVLQILKEYLETER